MDFSAPPLSVKCLTQNTSDEPILSPFQRKINNFSHPKVRLAGRDIVSKILVLIPQNEDRKAVVEFAGFK